jgi:hypothetical protein
MLESSPATAPAFWNISRESKDHDYLRKNIDFQPGLPLLALKPPSPAYTGPYFDFIFF